MSHNILITGGSGYLGGTLLARWHSAQLPAYHRLFALVRTPEQAEAVRKCGAEPLTFNVKDAVSARAAIIDNKITIVYFLIDAMTSEAQLPIIHALAEVKRQTGQEVHFLHTSGAKLFSSHAGHPTDRPLFDNDRNIYDLQKTSKPRWDMVRQGLAANNNVIETAEACGVRSYIFVPCIVYGPGEGFGNRTSIQTVAIFNAAKNLGRVYRPDADQFTWPVCHVIDNTMLYLDILRNILLEKDIGHGKSGYYLAASGGIAWNDIYCAMARRLFRRDIIDSEKVDLATDSALEEMGAALGCPKDMVPLFLGGHCTLEARRGREIGWKPQYAPEHIIEMADAEVDFILEEMSGKDGL